jgi:hypothetical protein
MDTLTRSQQTTTLRPHELLGAVLAGAMLVVSFMLIAPRVWRGRLVVTPPSRAITLQGTGPVRLFFEMRNAGNRSLTVKGISAG